MRAITYKGTISLGVLCLLKHSTAAVRKPPNVPSYVYLSVIIPVQFSLRLPDAIILSPCRIHFKHLFVLFAGLRTFYGTHPCMPCPPLTITFICLVLCLPRSTKKRARAQQCRVRYPLNYQTFSIHRNPRSCGYAIPQIAGVRQSLNPWKFERLDEVIDICLLALS